jgi:HJR/Mrr/RecB family endonuclease
MGSFGITRASLREELGNLVGVRVGLAVRENDVDSVIDAHLPDFQQGRRTSASEFAGLTFTTLKRFGDPWTDFGYKPVATACLELRDQGALHLARSVLDEIHQQVHMDKAYSWLHRSQDGCTYQGDDAFWAADDTFVDDADLDALDENSLLSRVAASLGHEGAEACRKLLSALKAKQRLDPWSRVERAAGEAVVSLAHLFQCGEATTQVHKFFDQRFINYLAANQYEADLIHWRQFERLVAEYFDRAGYYVELGPGSNDDGVDVRAWPQDGSKDAPPVLIVQCKRQRAKVSKVVVKALWADMQAERAQRGVLATTSFLEPGAERTIEARNYGIDVADGAAIAKWLLALREPGAGITCLQ